MGTMVENIRAICKEKGIPVSRLEKDLGYGNGFLNPKKIQVISAWRAVEISEYLGVTMDDLMGLETKKAPTTDGEDLADYLQDLRERPETRALLEASRGMTKEQVEQMAAFAKALRGGG